MSKEIDALGRSLHYVGINVDREVLRAVARELDKRGYTIAPTQASVNIVNGGVNSLFTGHQVEKLVDQINVMGKGGGGGYVR